MTRLEEGSDRVIRRAVVGKIVLSGQGRKYDDVCCAQFGLVRGARREHPPKWGCDRRATKPPGQIRRNPSGGGSFRPRPRCSLLTDPLPGYALVPVRKHLAPCLGRKLLAANVTEFTPWTTKDAMTYQITHTTTYHYRDSVSVSHHVLRLTPRDLSNQRCLSH